MQRRAEAGLQGRSGVHGVPVARGIGRTLDAWQTTNSIVHRGELNSCKDISSSGCSLLT